MDPSRPPFGYPQAPPRGYPSMMGRPVMNGPPQGPPPGGPPFYGGPPQMYQGGPPPFYGGPPRPMNPMAPMNQMPPMNPMNQMNPMNPMMMMNMPPRPMAPMAPMGMGMAPMGMPPMGMGMGSPNMRYVRPPVGMNLPPGVSPSQAAPAPLVQVYTPPIEKITTVFVGGLAEGLDDEFMEEFLKICGEIKTWKRVKDQEGKAKSFGFCDYEDAEGVLRALRLFSTLKIAGKDILIRVEEKTRKYLDDFELKKKQEKQETQAPTALEEVQGDAPKEPQEESDIPKPPEEPEDYSNLDATFKENLDKFLESKKDFLEGLQKKVDAAVQKEAEAAISKGLSSIRGNKEQSRREPSPDPEAIRREREAEASYRERLKRWEQRERQKQKDYERERERESERVHSVDKNRQRLLAILEDPKSNKEDEYYIDRDRYRAKRRRERDREEENDNRDRVNERLEIEEQQRREEALRRDAEERERRETEERRRQYERERELERQREAERQKEIEKRQEEERLARPQYAPAQFRYASSSELFGDGKDNVESKTEDGKFGFGLGKKNTPTAAPVLAKRANPFSADDDDAGSQNKKRTLIPIQYTQEEMLAVGVSKEEFEKRQKDEKKRQIQEIINKIPTDTESLFSYPVAWECVDASLIEGKMKPWVSKKLQDYLGTVEEDFVQFVLESLTNRKDPRSIVQELEMVLDKEAETFVLKLWRMLIFEATVRQSAIF